MDKSTESTEVLSRWRDDEARVRARSPVSGVPRRDQIANLTGLETFQALLAGNLPPPPICETLDFMLVEVDLGRAVFQGRPLMRHYNPLGTVHGGWFATLLDSAAGCAVHTALPARRSYTTAELKFNVVRPLTDKVPLVRAEGKVLHMGGRMATAEARMTGADGKLYAHASTTCFVFDTP
jgi:uncharacterized protein (TIGR00369 family)